MMKLCSKCGCEKPTADFYRCRGNKDGFSGRCKTCQNAENLAWKAANPEKMTAYKKKWDANNRDKVAAKTARWYEANKDRKKATNDAWETANKDRVNARKIKWAAENPAAVAAASKKWRDENRDVMNASKARRIARKRQATPAWANEFFIEEAYALAKLRTEMFGFEWHVDHVVPLRSAKVSGLHTHDNLRVIPWRDNLSKGNRHWPDMP